MILSKLRLLCVTASIALGAGAAQATPVTALYLAMDGSASITGTDFSTQISAYNSALTAFFGAHPGAFGQVAIGGGIFGADFQEFFAPAEISDATALSALETAISNLDPGRGSINTGATAIGGALQSAAASLANYDTLVGGGLNLIIDVTTDGQNNQAPDPVGVAASLVPASIAAINCLGIGAAADCSFVAGVGMNFGAVSFANLEAALTSKLEIETNNVPEPASMMVIGAGLAGLGLLRRKQA